MNLYPAIDILEGRAVRLVQGRYEDSTVYQDSPVAAAEAWVTEGARHLHIVDLDGARAGRPLSLGHLEEISRAVDVPIQYGGGLRTYAAVHDALAAGAARVILGTAAFTDPDLLAEAVEKWGEQIVVSVDVRGGHVATAGWTETTELSAADAIRGLRERGVRDFVYTNVERDGMLEGPDVEEVSALSWVAAGRLIYSGGIGELSHLEELADLGDARLAGVIVGKALYERRFTIAEARTALGRD